MPSNSPRLCPQCRKPTVHAYRPFCSRGCRDRDLNAWFDEDYRVPVQPAEEDEQDSIGPSVDGD